jgi:hypothetical protein
LNRRRTLPGERRLTLVFFNAFLPRLLARTYFVDIHRVNAETESRSREMAGMRAKRHARLVTRSTSPFSMAPSGLRLPKIAPLRSANLCASSPGKSAWRDVSPCASALRLLMAPPLYSVARYSSEHSSGLLQSVVRSPCVSPVDRSAKRRMNVKALHVQSARRKIREFGRSVAPVHSRRSPRRP